MAVGTNLRRSMDYRMESGFMVQVKGTLKERACMYFCFRSSWQYNKWMKGEREREEQAVMKFHSHGENAQHFLCWML